MVEIFLARALPPDAVDAITNTVSSPAIVPIAVGNSPASIAESNELARNVLLLVGSEALPC